jgi:uncharacterized protein YecT (DUF1311 family)
MNIYQAIRGVRPAALTMLAMTTAIGTAPPSSDRCENASSQAAQDICAGAAAKKADAKLNGAYTQVMARISPSGKLRLRDAQRAWLSFRAKEFMFRSSGDDGGSIAPMIAANCIQMLTTARTKDLAGIRVCDEGDLSCPR